TGNSGGSSVFGAVGRFTADGSGNITNGELDTNGVGPGAALAAQAFTGTYAIGADNRGVMTLNIPGGAKLAFAMMANGNAQFIEFDATGGVGTIGSGTMEKADTSAYNTANISGNYAFYFVNAGKLFVMGTDPVSASTPLLNGVVLRQQIPAGGFSNAALNGGMVIYLTGFTFCGNGSARSSDALAGLSTTDGNGAL